MIAAGLHIDLVASDRGCRGLDVARDAGITNALIDREAYGGFSSSFRREEYSEQLTATLHQHGIDLVAMAGFGTIVTTVVHEAFPSRILNTHPSLLPAFKGWHAVADCLAAGATSSGCTVHIATPALDEGPILAQARVEVLPTDTEESLHERIKLVERSLYPEVVRQAVAALDRGEDISTIAPPVERR